MEEDLFEMATWTYLPYNKDENEYNYLHLNMIFSHVLGTKIVHHSTGIHVQEGRSMKSRVKGILQRKQTTR